jgi:glycosyltransferase involved in cell wall biosynthesis
MTSTRPKISVVTPVFNGERFLAEAIESVRAQTCTDWEYVIADNCSTDRTVEIAERYAAIDPRIRVYRADRFLPIIGNWNRALRQIAPDSLYCKVLHADDRLFTECLERMAALMDAHPNVGIVGAYVLADKLIECDGLPYGRTVWDGREICRNTLLGRYYLFGSPSSLLIRADLIRARPEGFYNEGNVHADFEACYALLDSCDFGFVHQVLTFTRTHAGSMGNTFSRIYNPQLVEYLGMMRKYGPRYLDEQTYNRLHANMVRSYRRIVARRLISGRGRAYWEFHRDKLRGLGYSIGPADVARGAVEEGLRLLTRPREAAFLLAGLVSRALLDRERAQHR